MVFADGVTVEVGNNIWTIGLDLVLFVIIAAIVGFIAEFIVGWKLPFGFLGATLAGIIGVFLMTRVIVIQGIGDIYLWNVPIIRALIGAILFVGLWHLIAGGTRRRRRAV